MKNKFLTITTAALLFTSVSPTITVFANESDESTPNTEIGNEEVTPSTGVEEENFYEDDSFIYEKTDNGYKLTNKETNEVVSVSMTDENHGVLTNSEGTKEIYKDNIGNIYINGELQVEATQDTDNNQMQARASKWLFVKTYTYNTKTKGEMEGIVLGIMAFVPYVGTFAAIAAIVSSARSMGASILYVKVNQYRTSGYQFYKYDSYFYSNKAMTKLIKKTSQEKRMW